MSLDVSLYRTAADGTEETVFEANITGNLVPMARAAGLYLILWWPAMERIEFAEQLCPHLEGGLYRLENLPHHFQEYNPENGWGSYEVFVKFVVNYLEAAEEFPETKVRAL